MADACDANNRANSNELSRGIADSMLETAQKIVGGMSRISGGDEKDNGTDVATTLKPA